MSTKLSILFCSAAAFVILYPPEFTEAKKVVMFPSTTRSYILYHSFIAQSLVALGHEVWLCLPRDIAEEGIVSNETVHLLTYESIIPNDTLNFEDFSSFGYDSMYGLFKHDYKKENFVMKILEQKKFLRQLKDLKPDLFVLEMCIKTISFVVIPYKYDIPFAFIGIMHDALLTRTPFNPVTEPLILLSVTDKMTFCQRLKLSLVYITYLFYKPYLYDSVVQKFAPEKKPLSISDIVLKAEIFLFETDHIMDYPRPSLPNTKFIGSSSARMSKPLTGDLKVFADKSNNGLALVSFGSKNVQMPQHILDKMVAAFGKIKLNVIWKIKQIFINSTKVITKTWIPQNDLLGHSNTKIFISHCGKNGQYEALYQAVPMLCLPMQTDQFYNAQRVRVKGFGLSADLEKVSAEQLAGLIQQLSDDPKFRTNIQKASKLFKELYPSPRKEAAYWFDHVLKYGGDYMRSVGQDMPLYQYLLLDVITFILFTISLLTFILYLGIKRIFSYCFLIDKSKSKIE